MSVATLLDWTTLDNAVKTQFDSEAGIDTCQKAFPILMLTELLGISEEEAEDSITDGGKDRGADAVFIEDSTAVKVVNIFQFKYVNTFDKSKNNFPSTEVDKLGTLVAEILDKDSTLESTTNPILWNKIKEIWSVIASSAKTQFVVHFCGNCLPLTDEHQKRADSQFKKYSQFNVEHHSVDSIIRYFLEKEEVKIDEELTVVDTDFFERSDGNIRGLMCTIEAKEIVRLITNPDDNSDVRREIFNDNVRVYLKKTNKINRKIVETALSDNRNLFWYLNNGITITCDSFSYVKSRSPKVELKNVQIVNGGQTSNSLFEVSTTDPDKLDDVLVLVRIIEAKTEEVSVRIAESTNSQTPINSRDLRSNDDIQKKLEQSFKSLGYFYERKAKQFIDRPKNSRIDAISAGQAHLSYGLDLPEVAKKDRGRIFSDLYDTVFTDNLTAEELHCATKLLISIESKKRILQSQIKQSQPFNKEHLFLIDGAHHVLFTLGRICDAREIDRLDFDEAVKLIPDAIKYLSQLVDTAQKEDESFSFNRYFKDAKTKTNIAAHIQIEESKTQA